MDSRDWGAERVPGRDPLLSVVLPCFNEAANIRPMHAALSAACAGLSVEMIFVDDGSSDRTSAEVSLLAASDPSVRLLRFVRNAGHQNALRAGYRAARGRYVATLDADFQHPPDLLPAMLAKAREGYDVVQMAREGRQAGFLKDLLSRGFYRVFNAVSEAPIRPHASDFRLVSRAVCDVLSALPERNLIVRAILPYLGFRTAVLPYRLGERLHGRATFRFRQSLHLGTDALFGFSTVPLKLAMRAGLVVSALAFVYGFYNVGAKIFTDRNVPGYTDVIASVLFMGGLLFLYLGILGRYIQVIVDHLKRRPEYLLSADPEERSFPAPEAIPPRRAPNPGSGARPEGRRAGRPE